MGITGQALFNVSSSGAIDHNGGEELNATDLCGSTVCEQQMADLTEDLKFLEEENDELVSMVDEMLSRLNLTEHEFKCSWVKGA